MTINPTRRRMTRPTLARYRRTLPGYRRLGTADDTVKDTVRNFENVSSGDGSDVIYSSAVASQQ